MDNKLVKEKVVKTLELCQFLVKQVHQQVGVWRERLLPGETTVPLTIVLLSLAEALR